MLLRQRRISGQGPSFTFFSFFNCAKLQLSPVGMNFQSQRPCLSSLPLTLLPRAGTQQILIPLHRVSLEHRRCVCACVFGCVRAHACTALLLCIISTLSICGLGEQLETAFVGTASSSCCLSTVNQLLFSHLFSVWQASKSKFWRWENNHASMHSFLKTSKYCASLYCPFSVVDSTQGLGDSQ